MYDIHWPNAIFPTYIYIYKYGCVIAFYLFIVSKIIKKAHSDSVPLSIFRGYIALPITLVDNNLTRVVLYSTYIYKYTDLDIRMI